MGFQQGLIGIGDFGNPIHPKQIGTLQWSYDIYLGSFFPEVVRAPKSSCKEACLTVIRILQKTLLDVACTSLTTANVSSSKQVNLLGFITVFVRAPYRESKLNFSTTVPKPLTLIPKP